MEKLEEFRSKATIAEDAALKKDVILSELEDQINSMKLGITEASQRHSKEVYYRSFGRIMSSNCVLCRWSALKQR